MAYKFRSDKLATGVRAYRNQKGLSLRDLADLCQVSASTLSRIENQVAKLAPAMETLRLLLDVCEIRFEDIMQGDNDAENSQIQEISTQLRASKQVSSTTLQALEAVIRAVQQDRLPNQTL